LNCAQTMGVDFKKCNGLVKYGWLNLPNRQRFKNYHSF
jgi:hypothetical protein